MDAPNGKRTRTTTELENSRKKMKLPTFNMCDFLDIEASDSESCDEEADYGNDLVQGSIDDNSCRPTRSHTIVTANKDGQPLDYRLMAVVNRYEAQGAAGEGYTKSSENGDIAPLAERLSRLPTTTDPCMWRVRVRDGMEQESFWALQDRLWARPQLALSVILPPPGRMWIVVESRSGANVAELCFNLSMFPHPLDISLVPVEERTSLLNWKPTPPQLKSPSWARLQRPSVLKSLDVDRNLIKYSGDLAFVLEAERGSKALICLVPRLLITIGGDEKKRRRSWLPRLLHPKAIGEPEEAMDIAYLMDPNIWWCPNRRYELESVERGTYLLANTENQDEFMPPFAIFSVPLEALHVAGVAPTLSELNLFAEGMAVGAAQSDFLAPSLEFIRWTFEYYVAAPVEIGHKVEVDLKPGMVRGVVKDVEFEDVVVRIHDDTEVIQVDARCVRRFYQVGDTVKVVKSSNIDREGWVLDIKDDAIDVFDRIAKEEFHVKSWQLIPHDDFEWGFARRIQVGDTVQVATPLSPEYQKKGRVCRVTDSSVEVIEHQANTKFVVPSCFLDIDSALGRIMRVESPSGLYDRCKELVNTWVFVCGKHHEKGLYGRVRESLGNHLLRVEARSGARLVDIHVDFLYSTERDLRKYHVGRHTVPVGLGYQSPSFQTQPEPEPEPRGLTPMPDEPMAAEDLLDQPMSPVSARGNSQQGIQPAEHKFEEVVGVSTISHVLPANWLMRHGLATKRIYAYIRNTSDPCNEGRGFAGRAYEGQRVMILSGEREDAIQVVHLRHGHGIIPARYLFPQMPTSKGQVVVVISGDNVGEIFVTRQLNENGLFPLVAQGRGNRRREKYFVEPSRLAKCDAKLTISVLK